MGKPFYAGLVGRKEVRALAVPKPGSRKGDNGRVLVIAGSRRYHGAAITCCRAAAKLADLVYFSSTAENNQLIKELKLATAQVIVYSPRELKEIAEKVDAILIGPGVEPDAAAKKIVNGLLKEFAGTKNFVLDAGALRVLDKRLLTPKCILTPHAGEFKSLFGIPAAEENARRKAAEFGCVILLKGHVDVIAAGGRYWRNATGNPGMTKGGTGDCLAGVAAGFAANNPALLSAQAAAYVNGLAGDRLKKRMGYFYDAGDLVQEIPAALQSVY